MAAMASHLPRTGWILAVLSLEKVIQHAVVSWALAGDVASIRDTVVVDYRVLLVAGAAIGIGFAVGGIALVRRRAWSLPLLATLASIDIVGEFVAQGTISITLTVSLLVALVVVVLAIHLWRAGVAGNDADLAGVGPGTN